MKRVWQGIVLGSTCSLELDAGKLELRPEYAHKFYKDAFGRTEQSATVGLVVTAEQCPNCDHVETECQCGDLRDCW